MTHAILHITNVSNLLGIVHNGGLYSINHAPKTLAPQSSAHAGIQQRRARIQVPVGPKGVLHDYVPFYFGERSPMLYAIHRGNVANVPADQRPMIYLVSDVQTVAQSSCQWIFTDGHAVVHFTQFFDLPASLQQVDWNTVHARYWVDTADDPDRSRRKQAEFLVLQFFPFSLLTEIAVFDVNMEQHVLGLLAAASVTKPVKIRRDWYY